MCCCHWAQAFDLESCNVVVRPSNSRPTKGAVVRITTPRTPLALTRTLSFSVWFPTRVGAKVSDPTLQGLLPHNAGQPPAGCSDRFQSTPITASATWSNGGTGPKDSVADTDITDLCTFSSDDESSAMVSGRMVHGLKPAAGVEVFLDTYNRAVRASATVSVADEPVCIVDLVPVVAAGFSMTASASMTIDGSFSVTIVPQQASAAGHTCAAQHTHESVAGG
jgi:hypothetical protein